jgi:hypothetical protein
MIDQAILTMVRDLVTIFGVITGLTYYIFTVRNAKKARETQVFLSIYSQIREKDFYLNWQDIILKWEWKNYEDWMEKYGPTSNPEAWSTLASVGTMFNMLGYLQKVKQIDPIFAYENLRNMTYIFWERYGPMYREFRIRSNMPRAFLYIEYLYDEMKKREQKELKT